MEIQDVLGKDIKLGKWKRFVDTDLDEDEWQKDVVCCAVLYDGVPLRVVKERAPHIYEKNVRRIKKNRKLYLLEFGPVPDQRLTILICGPRTNATRETAKDIAEILYPDLSEDERVFKVGRKYNRYCNYDGQPVVMWPNFTGESLLREFTKESILYIFDPTPHEQAQATVHGEIRPTNKVNILCTTEDYKTFMDELADHDPIVLQKMYRRMPIIITLNDNSYDLGVSNYFLNKSRDIIDYSWQNHDLLSSAKLKQASHDNEDLARFLKTQMLMPIRDAADSAMAARLCNPKGFLGEKPNTTLQPELLLA